jgi:hypothetical protein
MGLRNLFNRPPKSRVENPNAELDQGMYYVYMIIGLQIVFVFGLTLVVMLVGKVISTPVWVYLAMFVLMISGCYYIYRKVKKHFQKLREAVQAAATSNRNYEISFMGGFLTMRVEQGASRRLLEAPPDHHDAVLDAEAIETTIAP